MITEQRPDSSLRIQAICSRSRRVESFTGSVGASTNYVSSAEA